MEASPRFQDPELATPNTVVAEVHRLQPKPGPDPQETIRILAVKVQDEMDRNALLQKAMQRMDKDNKRLLREIDDLMDASADRETVRTCLEYWQRHTGREGKRVCITMVSGRAKLVRWFLRHYTAREFCLAVRGMMATPWFPAHNKTDVEHVMKSGGDYNEGRVEEFIARGRVVLGLPEED